ncbi:MAG: SMC-Scp complex subunit ScpB, partial [Phycisphaerales bacterium]|nr:SMC-Scp complex subunit ScpB [Phycisphaerales bacterium]
SRPAMETLVVIGYRQPVTRAEIEDIRRVDTGAVLRTLLDRNLVRIVGRKDVPGRPVLYGTTREFLEMFGFQSLRDLPTLKEIKDVAAEMGAGLDLPDDLLDPSAADAADGSDLPAEDALASEPASQTPDPLDEQPGISENDGPDEDADDEDADDEDSDEDAADDPDGDPEDVDDSDDPEADLEDEDA